MRMLTMSGIYRAMRELGVLPIFLNGLYRLGLHSGYYSRVVRANAEFTGVPQNAWDIEAILSLPNRQDLKNNLGEQGQEKLFCEADEIVAGQVRLFGGKPQALDLAPQGELQHWTAYELGKAQVQAPHGDIKFIWEPSRFGWAIPLCRAYHLTHDERYSAAFWMHFETFRQHNPPFLGPNWVSGQEVALRLIAMIFSGQVLAASEHSTPVRRLQLAQSIALHAQRIPPTLIYARAQNNNHLLSEAAGLFSAALALPHHPDAPRWRKLGWEWFQRGIDKQITPDGVYVQHSTNYHRLMLQLGLWMNALIRRQGMVLPPMTGEKLAAATQWMLAFIDPVSGRIPNLGANDGAYILPLSVLPFDDYRPVAQAAGAAFLGAFPFQAGAWDEMRLWFGVDANLSQDEGAEGYSTRFAALRSKIGVICHPQNSHTWAYLRLAEFHDRPGHADLLHMDLWHQGENLALDAGTYLYNALPPWDNALTCTQVHNTVLVDRQEQMRRIGRFLYLDWARTRVVSQDFDTNGHLKSLVAQHDGYLRLGVLHRRVISAQENGSWFVEDHLLPADQNEKTRQGLHQFCLQWLLPDWAWTLETQIDTVCLTLEGPSTRWQLVIQSGSVQEAAYPLQVQLVRAGELLSGEGEISTIWGWRSPHYGDKIPALAFRCALEGQVPVSFKSYWTFEDI